MKKLTANIDLDKIGITASMICAVHCAFLPVLLTLLPLIGIGFSAESWMENFMVLVSIVVAGISLGSSYKLHQKYLPLVLLLIGVMLIATVRLFLPEKLEPFIMPFAGLMIAAAHYLNWSFSGKCTVNQLFTTPVHQSK